MDYIRQIDDLQDWRRHAEDAKRSADECARLMAELNRSATLVAVAEQRRDDAIRELERTRKAADATDAVARDLSAALAEATARSAKLERYLSEALTEAAARKAKFE